MKKSQTKRQRIPRRGPGVAELEKILKEQQGQHSDTTQFQDISPPPPVPLFLPPRDYSSNLSNLPLFPTPDLVPPALPATVADAAGKSDTQIMNNVPPPHFQFSASSLNRQYYNSMVNLTPGTTASSSPSATSSAATYFNQILEHPSSQRSTDFNHIWTSPEEQDQQIIISGKRARTFMDENESRSRIPNFSNIMMPLKHSASSSSSSSSFEINRTVINFDSNFRDETKKGFSGQLMRCSKSSGRYELAEEDSSILMALVGSSSTTPNQFPPFHHFQETMETSQHRDEGGSALDYNKITFNSSLYESNSKSKGGIVDTISSEAEATTEAEVEDEDEGDGIDLDLKL